MLSADIVGLLRHEKSATIFSLVAFDAVALIAHAMLFAFSMQICPMLVPLTPLIVGVTFAQHENDWSANKYYILYIQKLTCVHANYYIWSAHASDAPPGHKSEAVPPCIELGVVLVEYGQSQKYRYVVLKSKYLLVVTKSLGRHMYVTDVEFVKVVAVELARVPVVSLAQQERGRYFWQKESGWVVEFWPQVTWEQMGKQWSRLMRERAWQLLQGLIVSCLLIILIYLQFCQLTPLGPKEISVNTAHLGIKFVRVGVSDLMQHPQYKLTYRKCIMRI